MLRDLTPPGGPKTTSLAKLGADPWGNVLAAKVSGATPAEQITVLPGYKVELLRSAQPGEGSWVAMAVDEKGRLYLSPQGREKMLRVTLTSAGQIEKIDPIDLPVSGAMGLLWAFDSLYVNGQGPDGQAIYRLRDTNADDILDDAKLFKKSRAAAANTEPMLSCSDRTTRFTSRTETARL
jgi:hypothetical protein